MNEIYRYYKDTILKILKPGKAVMLIGPRRAGKTFLSKKMFSEFKGKKMFLNAEDITNSDMLSKRTKANYSLIFDDIKLLVIDEAQVIPDIGKKIKLIVDEFPEIRVLITGSSSFDLLNKAGEPLTGRSTLLKLFPVAQIELSKSENIIETTQNLETRLIYGSYPEIFSINDTEERKDYLYHIVQSYLLKDLLAYEGIRNSSKMISILKLLALQVGHEVSYNEIAGKSGLNKNTVEKYLDLLEKSYVLFHLGGYSRNLRKEITKNNKWYFWDNGILNALTGDFRPLSIRHDIGPLWENYLISEKLKTSHYKRIYNQYYFWRTYDQQEIDLIEENDKGLSAIEIKWNKEKIKLPIAFRNAYPKAKFELINNTNYLKWII